MREVAAARADQKALALMKDEALERLNAASSEALGHAREAEALKRELEEVRGALQEAVRDGDLLRAENNSMKEQLLSATRYAQALEQTVQHMGLAQQHQQYQLQAQHQQAQHQHQQAWGALQAGNVAADAAANATGHGVAAAAAWGAGSPAGTGFTEAQYAQAAEVAAAATAAAIAAANAD